MLSNLTDGFEQGATSVNGRLRERMGREDMMRYKRGADPCHKVSPGHLSTGVISFSDFDTASPQRPRTESGGQQKSRQHPKPAGRIASRLIREWQSASLLVDAVPGEQT
ncbi:MAG: hypothetical protein ACOC9Y_04465 [Chloroflexota bacterium]